MKNFYKVLLGIIFMLSVLPVNAVAETTKYPPITFGYGIMTCDMIITIIDEPIEYININSWITTYIDVLNVYNKTTIPLGIILSNDGMFLITMQYCADNPLNTLGDAVKHLGDILIEKANQ